MSRIGRPRFSLLNILLLMALAACAITICQLWNEVGPLRAEVRRLRDEVGVLSVDDPTKIHAIQVNTYDKLIWKWRVRIPPNRSFIIRCRGGRVPQDGFPGDGGHIPIRHGEQVISYRIDRDRRDEKWYGSLVTPFARVGKDEQEWVEWARRTSTSSGVGKTLRSSDPGQRIELIRYRVSEATDSTKIEDPSAGFMIWLEPTN